VGGAVRQVVIENPVINSPFEEPRRHFRFDDDGITDEIVSERRPSSYFIPIAKPRKKSKDAQQTFEDWPPTGSKRTRTSTAFASA
jgi:type III restriction enzyme